MTLKKMKKKVRKDKQYTIYLPNEEHIKVKEMIAADIDVAGMLRETLSEMYDEYKKEIK